MTPESQAERERFETWARTTDDGNCCDSDLRHNLVDENEYALPEVEGMWKAWRAALAAHPASMEMVNDQPITRMPERCVVWPCAGEGPVAKLRPRFRVGHWWMQCPLCDASYGICAAPVPGAKEGT